MLATGQLRHQIIKDHLLKKDEDLTSLAFKQQYKIKDILNCKVDNFLSPKREQSKHTGLSQNTKTTLRRSCQNAIDVYQKKDWKRSTLNKLTSIKTMDNTLCDKFEASCSCPHSDNKGVSNAKSETSSDSLTDSQSLSSKELSVFFDHEKPRSKSPKV